MAGTLGLMLSICFGVVGPWRNSFAVTTLRGFFVSPPPPPPIPPPGSPSKEYIYAGNKLIATEAPPVLAAPASMTATTISEPPTPQVNISWTASPGADHYEVERSTNVASSYVPVNLNVTTTTFTDTTVTSVTAYLYRVRAMNSAGSASPYSNVDLATAIAFTDNSIGTGSTPIKAEHLTQLRQAVNAVRAVTTNLNQVSWAESIVPGVTTVKASHIQELRTKLDEARNALGLSACAYTDASSGQLIQKVHIDQLRQCVK